jgi:hypothetical protein
MVSSAGSVMELSRSLDDAGYPTQVIGYVKPREKGLLALRNGQPVEWPVFPVDEITRLFV